MPQGRNNRKCVLAIGLKAILERMKLLVTQQWGLGQLQLSGIGGCPLDHQGLIACSAVVTVDGGKEGERNMEGAGELGLIFFQ